MNRSFEPTLHSRLGPEGDSKRGEVVAEGTPEVVAATERSYTGEYLAGTLGEAEAAE